MVVVMFMFMLMLMVMVVIFAAAGTAFPVVVMMLMLMVMLMVMVVIFAAAGAAFPVVVMMLMLMVVIFAATGTAFAVVVVVMMLMLMVVIFAAAGAAFAVIVVMVMRVRLPLFGIVLYHRYAACHAVNQLLNAFFRVGRGIWGIDHQPPAYKIHRSALDPIGFVHHRFGFRRTARAVQTFQCVPHFFHVIHLSAVSLSL